MELPADVLIHNQLLGMKGSRGKLLSISPEGYFEANVSFGDKLHRVLLPIASTAVIAREPEEPEAPGLEIER